MAHDGLEEFRHIWDVTQNWVLNAFYHHEADVKIEFIDERPNIQELFAVRNLLEEYRNMPVQTLKERIGESTVLSLGHTSAYAARELSVQTLKLGLKLKIIGRLYTSYLPVNETNQCALIIEDEALLERVTERMIEAGVRVIPVEVD